MAGRIKRAFSWITLQSAKRYSFIKKDIQKRPLTNFYLSLFVLILLITLSSFLQTKPSTPQQKPEVKEVSLYYIGSAPKMTVQAQIEKTGVITVIALSGGVVQKIHYHEGDTVHQGNTLISLSTNYQGGNAPSIQRQLANTQYQSALDTFDLQKDLLQGQREIVTTSTENARKLRDISSESRDTTRSLIDLNNSMLSSINSSLQNLQNNPQADSAMIDSLQGQKAQFLAGLAQAQASLAAADYQADSDRPPAKLQNLQKDLTLKQLDLQEKMLGVNKEVSRLQLQLAQVTENLMFPASPLSGVVQRIFIHEGDVVTPGEKLAVVGNDSSSNSITALAYVPGDIATKISRVEPSILMLSASTYEEYPYFISAEAVQGNSYALYYALPEN